MTLPASTAGSYASAGTAEAEACHSLHADVDMVGVLNGSETGLLCVSIIADCDEHTLISLAAGCACACHRCTRCCLGGFRSPRISTAAACAFEKRMLVSSISAAVMNLC
jgi:hypothetical protein